MDSLIPGQAGSNTIHGPAAATQVGAGAASAAVAAFLGPMRSAEPGSSARTAEGMAGRLRSSLGALLPEGLSGSPDSSVAARDSRTGLPSLALPRRKPQTVD